MPTNQLRAMTESSFLTALTIILALIGTYQPLFSMLLMVWSLPLIILIARHNLRYGIFSIVITTVLLLIFLTPVMAIPFILEGIPGAVVIGYGFARYWSSLRIFLGGFTANLIGTALFLIVTYYLSGIDAYHLQITAFSDAFSDTYTMLEGSGMNVDQVVNFKLQAQHFVELMTLLLPMVFIFSALFSTAINYMLSGTILKRLHFGPINTLPAFNTWRFPIVVAYLFAFALIGQYWGTHRDFPWLYQISLNVWIFTVFLGFLQGLAVINYMYKIKRISRKIVIVLIVLSILNMNFIFQLISFFGLIDMLFDYRKRFDNTTRNT